MLPSLAQLASSCVVNDGPKIKVRGAMKSDVLAVLLKHTGGLSSREIADELDIEQAQRIDDALFRLIAEKKVRRKRARRNVPNLGNTSIWIYSANDLH